MVRLRPLSAGVPSLRQAARGPHVSVEEPRQKAGRRLSSVHTDGSKDPAEMAFVPAAKSRPSSAKKRTSPTRVPRKDRPVSAVVRSTHPLITEDEGRALTREVFALCEELHASPEYVAALQRNLHAQSIVDLNMLRAVRDSLLTHRSNTLLVLRRIGARERVLGCLQDFIRGNPGKPSPPVIVEGESIAQSLQQCSESVDTAISQWMETARPLSATVDFRWRGTNYRAKMAEEGDIFVSVRKAWTEREQMMESRAAAEAEAERISTMKQAKQEDAAARLRSDAATKIQRWHRSRRSRVFFEYTMWKHRAAKKIQRVYKTSRAMQRDRFAQRVHQLISYVQAVWRGIQQRRVTGNLRLQHRSARAIQKVYRQRLAQRRLDVTLAEARERNDAGEIILHTLRTSLWRSRHGRFSKRRSATISLQRWLRAMWLRRAAKDSLGSGEAGMYTDASDLASLYASVNRGYNALNGSTKQDGTVVSSQESFAGGGMGVSQQRGSPDGGLLGSLLVSTEVHLTRPILGPHGDVGSPTGSMNEPPSPLEVSPVRASRSRSGTSPPQAAPPVVAVKPDPVVIPFPSCCKRVVRAPESQYVRTVFDDVPQRPPYTQGNPFWAGDMEAAVCIQRSYRGHRAKAQVAAKRSAHLKHAAELAILRHKNYCAARVQGVLRSWRAALFVAARPHPRARAALKVQKWYRRRVAANGTAATLLSLYHHQHELSAYVNAETWEQTWRRKAAATRISRWYARISRAFKQRQAIMRRSVLTIERGFSAFLRYRRTFLHKKRRTEAVEEERRRKEAEARRLERQAEMREDAACVVQACLHTILLRREYERKLALMEARWEAVQRRERATVTIQKNWRACDARAVAKRRAQERTARRVARLEKVREEELRNESASRIQCTFRSHASRQRSRWLHAQRSAARQSAATEIQRHVRGLLCRNDLRRKHLSASPVTEKMRRIRLDITGTEARTLAPLP